MAMEMAELRACSSVPPDQNLQMMLKFAALEKERNELRAMLKNSEDQLDSFRREIITLRMSASVMDPENYMLKSEHAELLKKRETELLADMKVQLLKGHAEMRRQTAEAVEAAASHQKAEMMRLEGDCSHVLSFLADVMNEVNTLRNKYEDWEEWDEAKGEEDDEGEDGDHLSGWYRTDGSYREAAGVGLDDHDYSERV